MPVVRGRGLGMSGQPAWTPGPWHWAHDAIRDDKIKSAAQETIAVMPGFGDTSDANARLIAAAPEMYEALKEMMREYEPGSSSDAIIIYPRPARTHRQPQMIITYSRPDAKYDLGQAARNAGVQLGNSSILSARRVRCVLVLDYTEKRAGRADHPEYQRVGFSRAANGKRRRIASVCWHGYGQFMREVFRMDPDARISTGHETYRGLADFQAKAPATGDHNIGSQVDPMRFEDACLCPTTAPWQDE